MAVAIVEITTDEYKELVRESERAAIIRRALENGDYVSADDIKNIFGINRKVEKDGRCEEPKNL